jgi:hypothetical protein
MMAGSTPRASILGASLGRARLRTPRVLAVLAAGLCAITAISCNVRSEPCGSDADEPNDSRATARDLGELNDSPGSSLTRDLTSHSNLDEDWFQARIRDEGNDGDPRIIAEVPAGYEVTTWFECENGTPSEASVACDQGSRVDEPTVSAFAGCKGTPRIVNSKTDCPGTSDDHGTLILRVKKDAKVTEVSCQRYQLELKVE